MEDRKPLGGRAYGSIPHLPGSRQGRDDIGLSAGQARICLERPRRGDTVLVLEKLDGACVAVANVSGTVVALIRAGYRAADSPREQFQMFDRWVDDNADLFSFLRPGERLCGEWLALAHGTRYDLGPRAPFVAFDIIQEQKRLAWGEVADRCGAAGVATAPLLAASRFGNGVGIDEALSILGTYGHYGALDPAEGCVWRVENERGVDFLAKYVRPEKVDGAYFAEITGEGDVWNWLPQGGVR